jgi:hypothetical protein
MPRGARSTALKRTKDGKLVSKKSKTNDPACSQAMSAWKTSGMTSSIAAILGRCRAKARALNMAAGTRLAGNEGRAQALEARVALDKPLTIKARLARAKELRAQRASGAAKPGGVVSTTPAQRAESRAVSSYVRGGGREAFVQPGSTFRATLASQRITDAAKLRAMPKSQRRESGHRSTTAQIQRSKNYQQAGRNAETRGEKTGMRGEDRKQLAGGIRAVRQYGDKITKNSAAELAKEGRDRQGRTGGDDGYTARAAGVSRIMANRAQRAAAQRSAVATPTRPTLREQADAARARKGTAGERAAKVVQRARVINANLVNRNQSLSTSVEFSRTQLRDANHMRDAFSQRQATQAINTRAAEIEKLRKRNNRLASLAKRARTFGGL